jgi:hypothetical protein
MSPIPRWSFPINIPPVHTGSSWVVSVVVGVDVPDVVAVEVDSEVAEVVGVDVGDVVGVLVTEDHETTKAVAVSSSAPTVTRNAPSATNFFNKSIAAFISS